jgi:hypothetical protein
MAVPKTSQPTGTVYRVARHDGALRHSEITPADNRSGRAGNRYDVVGGGVLYAASTVRTCFAETMSRFRPTPVMRALLRRQEPDEHHFMIVGGIPQDWRLQRRIFELQISDPLPFLDVESPSTLTHLEEELSHVLTALGYKDNLDLGDIRNRDRRLSREIAGWAYTAQDDVGTPLYSGIRYNSRVQPSQECWAIFDGTPVKVTATRTIELSNVDLKAVADSWDLHPY